MRHHTILREIKSDRWCLYWFTIWAIQWRQQTHALLSPSSGSTPAICLCIWSTPHLGHRRVGVWWWRLARCLQILSYESRRSSVLRCSFLPSRMAEASIHDLHGFAFWSPSSSYILQSIQSFCGGFVTSMRILFDKFVFWWCTCDGSEVLQGIWPMGHAISQLSLGHTFFGREMPEDAALRYILGAWPWFQSSSCTGHHPVLGAWAHWAEATPSHEAGWGFQQTATRSRCQDLWRCQFLRTWCLGAHWLWRIGSYQAQATGTHLRVNWGVAQLL